MLYLKHLFKERKKKMNIFGLIKDVASVAQKADNLDLYKKLLDVSSMGKFHEVLF
jgi:hypothetical protein